MRPFLSYCGSYGLTKWSRYHFIIHLHSFAIQKPITYASMECQNTHIHAPTNHSHKSKMTTRKRKSSSDDSDGRLNKHLFHFIFLGNRKVNVSWSHRIARPFNKQQQRNTERAHLARDIKMSAECQHNRCRFNSSDVPSNVFAVVQQQAA